MWEVCGLLMGSDCAVQSKCYGRIKSFGVKIEELRTRKGTEGEGSRGLAGQTKFVRVYNLLWKSFWAM